MAFPTSPVDGQIFNDYIYNETKEAWTKYINAKKLNGLADFQFLRSDINTSLTSTADSVSIIDGALTIAGGVGIAKNLNIGGEINGKFNYGNYPKWRSLITYTYDGSSVHYYWNRILILDTASYYISFDIIAKDDYNYENVGHYILDISIYNGSSISVYNSKIAGNIDLTVVVNNSGEIWIKTQLSWSSKFVIKQTLSSRNKEEMLGTIITQESQPTGTIVNPNSSIRLTM